MNNRIVYVEQFYFPEGWGGAQWPRDITVHLVVHGYDVEVICGADRYAAPDDKSAEDPASRGVRIRRVPRLLPGEIHKWKIARQLWFYVAAFPLLLLRRRPSLFITQTNPPLIVWLVAIVAMLQRCRFAIVSQDLYPEVVFAHRMMADGGIGARMLRRIFRWAYRRAAAVVSLGPVMSRRIIAKGVDESRIRYISNWATGDESVVRGGDNTLRAAWGLVGKFVILYSGNLGVAHDIETPLRAFAHAASRQPNLRFVFIGKGTRLTEARDLTAQLNIEDSVQFRPLVPLELLPQSVGIADLALVTLRRGFEGLVVPSKLLGYMARGIPTLYVGPPSDVQEFLMEASGGIWIQNGEDCELASELLRLEADRMRCESMGTAARDYYRRALAREVGLTRYLDLVKSLAPVRR